MKGKTTYFCTECGNETPKWQGRCTACGSWNTITEQPVEKRQGTLQKTVQTKSSPKLLSLLDRTHEIRFSTGLKELDRVLGGRAVIGSLVLVAARLGSANQLFCFRFVDISANVTKYFMLLVRSRSISSKCAPSVSM
jgi:DNA repair protein RadA/Sms